MISKDFLKTTWIYKYCRGFFMWPKRFLLLVFCKEEVLLDDLSEKLDGGSVYKQKGKILEKMWCKE